jgi:RNA polymerase sigma-70 factor, ECF subfamily
LNEEADDRDEILVRAHLDGSETAFRELVDRHAPNLAAVLERRVGDYHLALDLLQEVFIKLYRMLPRYRFEGRFRSLLYSMALNRARDALRKKKRSKTVYLEDHEINEIEPLTYTPVESRDQRRFIDAVLRRVESPYHEALYLRDVAGLSYREVAQTLDCSQGTVKSRVNRGRLAFRDIYLKMTGETTYRSRGERHGS